MKTKVKEAKRDFGDKETCTHPKAWSTSNQKADKVRFTANVKQRLFDEDRKMRFRGICAKDKIKKEIPTTQTHPKPSGLK